jgi:hypothetical protein
MIYRERKKDPLVDGTPLGFAGGGIRRVTEREAQKLTVSPSSSSFSASAAVDTGLMAIASAPVGGFAKWSLHFFPVLLGPALDEPDPGASSYCTERPSLIPGLALRANTCATLVRRRMGLPFAGANAGGDVAVRASTKGSPSVAGGSSARRGDSMVVADSGWEMLPTLVGTVRERERIARPGVSSITVTSVTGSEMSVRTEEEPPGADTTRWVVVWVSARRTVLLAAVVDGPGSGLCVSLRMDLSSNCGKKNLA